MWSHGTPPDTPEKVNGVRMPDDATARPGVAADSAVHSASITAKTTMNRPPHAAGGRGFTRLPSGSTNSTGRKQPSFMGRDGSRKQRSAKSAPDTTWEVP